MSQPQFRIFLPKLVPITGTCLQKEKIICINNSFRSISSIQSLSHVWLFATPWTAAHQTTCPSPAPGVHSNSCPSSRWCHLTISSSVIPFSWLQSFPASGSFQMSQFFTWDGQNIGVSAQHLPCNEYSGLISFRMDWLDLLVVQGTFKSLLQHHSSKADNSSVLSFLYRPTLTSIHEYWKNNSFDWTDFSWQSNVSAF